MALVNYNLMEYIQPIPELSLEHVPILWDLKSLPEEEAEGTIIRGIFTIRLSNPPNPGTFEQNPSVITLYYNPFPELQVTN